MSDPEKNLDNLKPEMKVIRRLGDAIWECVENVVMDLTDEGFEFPPDDSDEYSETIDRLLTMATTGRDPKKG